MDPTAGDGVIRYAQGCTVSGAKVQAEFDKAIGMAKSSDVAIVVLGTDLEVADESHDRSNITLPGVQEQLLKEVFQANPKTILVLVTGASLAVSWANDYLPAIICSWYNGQAQGTALTEVVFGQFNPKGKLTTTWYRSLADLPSFNDYNIRNNRTYMYFTGTPLFPFGYGLSYTTFEYSNLKISNNNLNKGDSVVISTDIRNSGTMTGTEIAQFYVQVESPYLVRPQKELKGFAQVTLEPGETRTVDFVLKHDALAYYDENDKTFVVETSKTHIMVGASSSDIRLKGSVMVTGAPVATTYRNNPFQQIEAETFENKSKTVKLVFCADSTQSLAGLTNNSYVAYKNMDFATGARQISLSLASLADDATVGIMLDSLDGILAGTLKVSNTGSLETYTEQSCGLAHTEGTRDLFLVFKTSKADALRVNWIRFDKTVSSGKIKENKESFFNLYPNPAKTKVKVDYCLNEMESAELSVYSMQGKLIKSVVLPGEGSGQYHSEFDCASLFPYQGLYLVRFNSVGFNKTMLISFVR